MVRVAASGDVPKGAARVDLGDVDLAPGFVDLQVNGGGGALFNDAQDVACLRDRARPTGASGPRRSSRPSSPTASRRARPRRGERGGGRRPRPSSGCTSRPLPRRAQARRPRRRPGPRSRPGDLDAMFEGARGVTLVTAAARRLEGGLREGLCAGPRRRRVPRPLRVHRRRGHRRVRRRRRALVTHLYNAMGLQHRAPGVVGAAFAHDRVVCGLIADGVHVDMAAARAAWKALGTDRLALVTDAVHPVGTDMTEFELGGQRGANPRGRPLRQRGGRPRRLRARHGLRRAVRGGRHGRVAHGRARHGVAHSRPRDRPRGRRSARSAPAPARTSWPSAPTSP